MNRVLKKIDLYVFKKIDQLKDNQNYQKIIEPLSQLPDEYQSIVGNLISLLLIALPFSLVFFMFTQVTVLEEDFAVKSKILALSQSILNNSDEVKKASRLIVSPKAIEKQEALTPLLSTLAASANFTSEKIRITTFETKQISPNIVQMNAVLVFNSLTLKNLTSFLTNIEFQQKMRIEEIQIERDPENLLKGSLTVNHLGRITSEESEVKP